MTISKLTPYQLQQLRKEKKRLQAIERRVPYKNMTDKQIRSFVPIVETRLVSSKHTGSISLVVNECPVCGGKHFHGVGDLQGGTRAIHCRNDDNEVVPYNYELVIDWSDTENTQLRDVVIKRQAYKSKKRGDAMKGGE